jgi:deoxyribose-phosphate aldolase
MAASGEDTPLARHIERALFAADATRRDLEKLCAEAREQEWFGVCVNGSRVELVRTLLEESDVRVVALVGFPWGAATTDAKRYETEAAVDDGAHEVDVVINIGRLKEGDGRFVLRELRDIVEAAEERPVKAVLETHLLTREEMIVGLELAMESGAQFVATSTDWHVPGVRVEDVALLREKAGAEFGIKAAGNIPDARAALALMRAGATRIGVASDILSQSGPA